MRRASTRFSRWGAIHSIPFTVFVPVVFLCLLIFPSVAFCATWELIGPDGGNFIFSMTNPENADEVTAITTSPSPSNVYRSNDAGATWSKIGEIPYPYIYDVSAFDFSTLYAISGSRCYRSADGGISWSEGRLPTSSGYARRVCVHPTNSRIVYAVGAYSDYSDGSFTYNMVFFKSTDGGLSWSASQFFDFEYFYPRDMAISATYPDVMYVAGTKETDLYYGGALLMTTDGGQTWTDISSNLNTERYSYFDSVAIDPTDGGKVYVGGEYFYRGTRGTGRDPELTWTRSQAPLYIYTICIDPVDPSRIYAGGYESIAVSTNYGLSWDLRLNSVKGVAGHVAVAPADSFKAYVLTNAGFYKSSDWGSNWNTAHEGIAAGRINALAVDPSVLIVQNSGYLMTYGGGRIDIWRDAVTPPSCGEVCDIQINPDNPDSVLILEGYG
ncbi:MAG: WD40/YVTN/BNR-like repeat-containing protein [Planctomycetota bacterium]